MDAPADSSNSGSLSRRHLLKLGGAAAGAVALGSIDGWQPGGRTPRAALAAPPANEHFERTWARTDKPVLDGNVSRTWMWGPEAFTGPLMEPYAESPGEERLVQYFDKARMEITNPGGDTSSIWYVTNGLLVVELITGKLQVGHNSFQNRAAAQVNVAGDMDDPDGPTYATFASLLDAPPLGLNSIVTQRVDRQGNVTSEGGLADQGVTIGQIDDVTNHSIAAPFWEFMNSSGMVYQNGGLTQDKLFENPYFATGRPISEPYWADVKVAGTVRLVLVQCFERRALTYTPGNPPGWLVEAGNVGLHYYAWRYGGEEPIDPGEFCVPAFDDHKPKTSPGEKLQQLLQTTEVPSSLAAAFFQMGRRYVAGHQPANELEVATFAEFAKLPAGALDVLTCTLGKLDSMPEEWRTSLLNPMFPLDESPVTPEQLTNELAFEIVQRASLRIFGNAQCMTEERPGLKRPMPGLDGVTWYTPTITRINELRTRQFGLPWDQYTREELQEFCTIVPVDTDGDGIPDTAQDNCPVAPMPCPGHTLAPVCMRVLEVRPGDMVALTGANYFNVAARVRFTIGETVREVPAHVCGDVDTPATELIDGVQNPIIDHRVQDHITFVVPSDMASGTYSIQVVVDDPEYTWAGDNEYLRVVAPPTATYTIASEELICVNETSPAGLGSDEVGLRIITVPIEMNGMLGAMQHHKFGGGTAGVLEDVDSGETRDISRILFQRNNIAGVMVAVLGFEVDSESAYRDQVMTWADAFTQIVQSALGAIISGLAGAIAGIIGAIFTLSAAWISAIAAAITFAITAIVAWWAPADWIMEDMFGLSALDLDELTSSNFQPRPKATYTTSHGIAVAVEPHSKIVDFRELRTYVSSKEGSTYQLRLRYSRS